MFDIAEFNIIGRIGKIKEFDSIVRVSIASNASYKDTTTGDWVDRVYWNEVAIFDIGTRNYVTKNMNAGDYVRARGIIRQNNFEKNGEKVFKTDLIVESFSRLPVKKNNTTDQAGEQGPEDQVPY